MDSLLYPFHQTVLVNLFQTKQLAQKQQHLAQYPHEAFHNFHCHDGVELLFVHKGSGKVVVDGEFYPFSDNTLVVTKPFQLHGLVVEDESKYCRSVFLFDVNALGPYAKPFAQLSAQLALFCAARNQTHVFYDLPPAFQQEYERARLRLGQDVYQGVLGEVQALCLLSLLETLFACRPTLQSDCPRLTPQDETIVAILQWVEQNYTKPYRAEVLAQALMFSKHYLMHSFKQHMGITISMYVTQRRLREAKALLQNDRASIEALSERLGFSSASHFCKVFRQQVGVSPYQYRKGQRDV